MKQGLRDWQLTLQDAASKVPNFLHLTSETGERRPGWYGRVKNAHHKAESEDMYETQLQPTHMLSPAHLVGMGFANEEELDQFLIEYGEEFGILASYELATSTTVVIPTAISGWAFDRVQKLGLHVMKVPVKAPEELRDDEKLRFDASRKARILTGRVE